jgi:hypothetical protein
VAAYTYNDELVTSIDHARSLLGDTAVTPGTTTIPEVDAYLSNEAIQAALTLYPPFALGVAFLADSLRARFAQEPVRVTLSGISVDFTERAAYWDALAKRLRAEHAQAKAEQARTAAAAFFTLGRGGRGR